jgi:hypothetical protein
VSLVSDIRQRLNRVGSDQGQLELLRRLLASTEDVKVLRAIAVAAQELADYVPDDMLGTIGDLKDRIFEKAERLGAASPSSPSPQRPKRALCNPVSPQVRMVVGPWATDEFGNLSREVYADPDGPMWRP